MTCKKKILILSGIAAAINYILSLTQAEDVELFVADADPFCPGLYMAGVTPLLAPRARERDDYRAFLDETIARYGIDIVIPTSDYDVEAVMELFAQGWMPPARMFRPPLQAYRILGHKYRLASALAQIFPDNFPRTVDAEDDAGNLHWPVVVKPAGEAGGKGVAIVPNAEDLSAATKRLRNFSGDVLFQEFIPGDTWVLTMVYDHAGKLVVAQPMRSRLTFFTWGGGGCAGEVMDCPELVVIGAKIVEAAGGWRGAINLEWRRRSETSQFFLIEANCRLNGYSYITTMNGLNLPRLMTSLLAEETVPALSVAPLPGRTPFVIGYRETPITEWFEAGAPRSVRACENAAGS